jgi:two-component SAPR family response regulator
VIRCEAARLEPFLRWLSRSSSLSERVRTLGVQPARTAQAAPASDEKRPATLRIRTLGLVQTWAGEELIPRPRWRGTKSLELAVFVAMEEDGRTRDEIVDALWPEAQMGQGATRLHTTAYRLRRGAGRDVLEGAGGRYRIIPGSVWCDAVDFRAQIRKARSPRTQGADRLSSLREAIDLYTGPFAPDWEAEWATDVRRELQRLHREAVVDAANLALDHGEPHEAASMLVALAQHDAVDEDVQVLALMALERAGDWLGLGREYERLTRQLMELGLAPPMAAQAVWRRAQRHLQA